MGKVAAFKRISYIYEVEKYNGECFGSSTHYRRASEHTRLSIGGVVLILPSTRRIIQCVYIDMFVTKCHVQL